MEILGCHQQYYAKNKFSMRIELFDEEINEGIMAIINMQLMTLKLL